MSATMKDKDTVSKGPKRRDETCYQVLHDIVIPAGTILRQEPGKPGFFGCEVAGGNFAMKAETPFAHCGKFKRVVA